MQCFIGYYYSYGHAPMSVHYDYYMLHPSSYEKRKQLLLVSLQVFYGLLQVWVYDISLWMLLVSSSILWSV